MQQAIGALNNPMVAGMLNRVRPGLVDQLKRVADEVSGEIADGALRGQPPTVPADPAASLRDRLSRLK